MAATMTWEPGKTWKNGKKLEKWYFGPKNLENGIDRKPKIMFFWREIPMIFEGLFEKTFSNLNKHF